MRTGFPTVRRLLGALLLLAAARLPAAAEDHPFTGAGILPYAAHEGRILVLLGYDPGRGWTSFGGLPERVRSLARPGPRWETPLETALREGFEELRQVVPREELRRGIDPDRCFPRVGEKGAFRHYPVEITFHPLEQFLEHFVPAGSAYDEKQGYIWVPLEELRRLALAGAAASTSPAGGDGLWPVFLADLRPALADPGYRRLFPLTREGEGKPAPGSEAGLVTETEASAAQRHPGARSAARVDRGGRPAAAVHPCRTR